MVMASLLAQGWTIALAARLLRLRVTPTSGLVERIELQLPGNAEVELVGYRIHLDSAIAGGERVPRWARPLLILRGGRTYSVHNAGPLQPDDQIYLFAAPKRVQILDRIYTRPGGLDDREVHGDFALKPEVTIAELEHQYGLSIGSAPNRALGELLNREFNGHPAPGDRLALGPIDLVVRSISDAGEIEEVGLVIEPTFDSAGWWLSPRRLLQRILGREHRGDGPD